MKGVTVHRGGRARPAPSLSCQRVGGCTSRTVLTILMVASLLAAACLICVWSRTEEYTQGYANSEVASELRLLTQEQENLRVEVAALRSPDRIESIARDVLGMSMPDRKQIRVVEWNNKEQMSVTTLAQRRVK